MVQIACLAPSPKLLSQGREAAPSGWRGPQRSEDTGLTGRILDARVLNTLKHEQGDASPSPCSC